MAEAAPALRIAGISKSFGPSQALSDVSFDIGRGKVHALVGENGAGKSTLVKIITGIIEADRGDLFLGGEHVRFRTPIEARSGRRRRRLSGPQALPPSRRRREHLDGQRADHRASEPSTGRPCIPAPRQRSASSASTSTRYALIAGLSVAELQFVEIARALTADLQFLILDEPTSALTPAEAEKLFRIVRGLRDEGKSVMLITHRLEELDLIADDITVLRDGAHVATRPARTVSRG